VVSFSKTLCYNVIIKSRRKVDKMVTIKYLVKTLGEEKIVDNINDARIIARLILIGQCSGSSPVEIYEMKIRLISKSTPTGFVDIK
jgi:hypothetical protein